MIGARGVLGVCEAILNMNPMPNMNIVELPHHEPRILLPLPHAQATLPQELVLTRTSTPNKNQDVRIDGRKQSEYFADRSASNPFMSMLIAPRLFPQKILDTKVLKTRSAPHVAMEIIK